MKRSGKFYRNNEKEIMIQLGLKPTINSGSGPLEKEDGQSETIICQLKSTDANSIKINKQDIDTLEYNSIVCHKLPVFAIQFIQSNDVYLLVKPELIHEVSDCLRLKDNKSDDKIYRLNEELIIGHSGESQHKVNKSIKSSEDAKNKFKLENENKFKKEKRSAI